MVAQPTRRREELLEGGPLRYFALLRLPAVSPGIQVLVEECSHVKFVKRKKSRRNPKPIPLTNLTWEHSSTSTWIPGETAGNRRSAKYRSGPPSKSSSLRRVG